jgi:hypothetical protein
MNMFDLIVKIKKGNLSFDSQQVKHKKLCFQYSFI